MEKLSNISRRTKKVVWGFAFVLLTLVILTGGVFAWAWNSTDTSLVARGIMWGDADTDDWQRFPSREVQASSHPISFKPSTQNLLGDIKVEGTIPLDSYLEETNTTAFIILHGDELLYEKYSSGSSREAMQASLSVAKSFVSTLVGIAIEEGTISSLDDPVTVYIPELASRDPRFEDITLRHLISMSSGIRYQADSSLFSDDFITYYSPDLRAAALSSEIEGTPGVQFQYNDFNPLLIGMVLERATGMPVSEYLQTRLWQPMGAEGNASWDMDSKRSGFEKMTVGVNGRAIDFLKLGWLFLNGGKNGESQIVPADWIEEATRVDRKTDPAGHYQYYWWVDEARHAYYAEGNFCQFIYVYPDAELVLVRFGKDCGGTGWIGFLGNVANYLETQLIE